MKYSTVSIFASIAVLFFCGAETSPIHISNSGPEECGFSASLEAPWFIKMKKNLHVPPPIKTSQFDPPTIKTEFIEQKLDHFDSLNNATWNMRYMSNDQFYNPGGPIFLMIGGEWEINTSYLKAGQMFKVAEQNHGYMFYTEHRYYGHSKPTNDLSIENLQYLTIDQALEDLAHFIQQKKTELNATKVIVFGGSYAGNLAAWSRIKFPHLVQGAVASSAPVEAKVNFNEYFEIVNKDLASVSQLCVDNIQSAMKQIENYLLCDEGTEALSELFVLCKKTNLRDQATVSNFLSTIGVLFGGNVTHAKGPTDIRKLCTRMLDKSSLPIDNLAQYFVRDVCNDYSYEKMIALHKETSWCSQAANESLRQWDYQTCTELGFFQTSALYELPLNYFIKMCVDIFGTKMTPEVVRQGVERTNLIYGGRNPDVTNVVFIYGSLDPWHALGVLKNLSDKTPVFYVEGTSHCADLDQPPTNMEMAIVQQKTRRFIKKWLNN